MHVILSRQNSSEVILILIIVSFLSESASLLLCGFWWWYRQLTLWLGFTTVLFKILLLFTLLSIICCYWCTGIHPQCPFCFFCLGSALGNESCFVCLPPTSLCVSEAQRHRICCGLCYIPVLRAQSPTQDRCSVTIKGMDSVSSVAQIIKLLCKKKKSRSRVPVYHTSVQYMHFILSNH